MNSSHADRHLPPPSPTASRRSTPARMSPPPPGSATRRPSRSATAPSLLAQGRRDAPRRGASGRRRSSSPASDGERLVTGGDDGRVAVTGRDGRRSELADDRRAAGSTRSRSTRAARVAWCAGKNVTARDDKGREKTFEAPSTARGLAFAPKGYRLAMSHYNGVTLWFPNLDAPARAARMEGLASRRHAVAGRALPRHLDAGERAAWLAPAAGQGPHAHVRLPGEDALLSHGRMTATGWRPPAPTPPSSGPSSRRRGRWARRRANAASAPAKVTRVAFHPKACVAGHRLRGRLHPARAA